LSHFELESGAVIFHENFAGVEGIKHRYFIVIVSGSPTVECFTTTTPKFAHTQPKLRTEYCEIPEKECCLPKHCFVDLRNVYEFDDIALGSKIRSKSVRCLGYLPAATTDRLRSAINDCRSLSPDQKDRFLQSLNTSTGTGNDSPL
jgi:hypothetical protein